MIIDEYWWILQSQDLDRLDCVHIPHHHFKKQSQREHTMSKYSTYILNIGAKWNKSQSLLFLPSLFVGVSI
jgi:hypothetical protein